VRDLLKPFLKEAAKASTTSSEKLVFHIAVMRWKCSLLDPDELNTLQDWIDEQQTARQKAQAPPWSAEANEYGDELFAENSHIQWYALFPTYRDSTLTLHLTVPLTIFHPLCSWPLRRSKGKRVGRRWSFSVALNPKRGRFPRVWSFCGLLER
jgi:hypothetical protein